MLLTTALVQPASSVLDEQTPHGTLIRFVARRVLRSAEITGLRVRDLKSAARDIEVGRTILKVSGEWTVGTLESAQSTRKAPLLNRALIAELRELVLAHPDSAAAEALFWPSPKYHEDSTGLDRWA